MEYIHPKKYQEIKPDIPEKQERIKARVERYCLKCSLFTGQEHDFSECYTYDMWKDGKIIKKKTCPFGNMELGINPEVKLKSEE